MDWQGQIGSENIEDRRGNNGKYVVSGGIGTLLLAAVLYLFGGDPSQILNEASSQTEYSQPHTENDAGKDFVSIILKSTDDIWTEKFNEMGQRYRKPTIVLFTQRTLSECGGASSSTGPFYCPADKKVYLDLSFFNQMSQEFQVNEEFAFAYVIAHEIGHHVQDLLGISDKVTQLQNQSNETEANKLSVMLELQADFFAGYWAHYTQSRFKLNEQDINGALQAAHAIGDDNLQKQTQGYVVPDSFTHGTSEQRIFWFMKGFNSGDLKQSNTFE